MRGIILDSGESNTLGAISDCKELVCRKSVNRHITTDNCNRVVNILTGTYAVEGGCVWQ